MTLDPNLIALASCPVIEQEQEGGHIMFHPYPVISASSSIILAHEICHRLSGVVSFNKFVTACEARGNDELFTHILNLLVDWWDELNYADHSAYLRSRIDDLHQKTITELDASKIPDSLRELYLLYITGIKPSNFPEVTCIEDLIVYADQVTEELPKADKLVIEAIIKLSKKGGLGAGGDLAKDAKKSNFYLKTVSKYNNIIEVVSTLWTKNKYKWKQSYFGEISYKNLPQLLLGDKLGLPVYRLFQKLDINRSIYLVVDRSGSTSEIKVPIMETAIIIAESLRRNSVPISILDVGFDNHKRKMDGSNHYTVNKIDEPLDFDWFTPQSGGGTPIGEAVASINKTSPEDYLLIITDGEPNSFEVLKDSVARFQGEDLTCVIGPSFKRYFEQLNGHALSVEPTTLIRELINNSTLQG